MGIRLDISVETPLSDDDRDILAGISVMVLAIANRQNLAEQAVELERQADEDAIVSMESASCGVQDPDDPDRCCIGEPGHPGRHRHRPRPPMN